MVSRGNTGEVGGGVRKLVWLAEQLFTSLSFLSPPLFLAPSLYSALYSAEMTGGKLYCSEFVSIGAPLRGEAGGRAERALSQRPRLLAPLPPPSLLPTYPLTPVSSCFFRTLLLFAHSEIQIRGSYSQRLGEGEHEKSKRERDGDGEIE